jgi:hypothetical protein
MTVFITGKITTGKNAKRQLNKLPVGYSDFSVTFLPFEIEG